MVNTKPMPIPSKWSKPFWDGVKQHKLLLKKCCQCGKIDHPPYIYCSECWSDQYEWIQVSGLGKIYAFSTVLLGAPLEFTNDIPYTIAMVDLKEGPRILTTIVNAQPEELKIGIDVKILFDDITDGVTLPRFQPLK